MVNRILVDNPVDPYDRLYRLGDVHTTGATSESGVVWYLVVQNLVDTPWISWISKKHQIIANGD